MKQPNTFINQLQKACTRVNLPFLTKRSAALSAPLEKATRMSGTQTAVGAATQTVATKGVATKGAATTKHVAASGSPYAFAASRAHNSGYYHDAQGQRFDRLAVEGYQRNVIVYRCVNLVARALGSVPLLLYRGDHEIEKHPILDLLTVPSPMQAGSTFIENVISYLLLSGNTYIEALLNADGAPIGLSAVRPDRVRVVPARYQNRGLRAVPEAYVATLPTYMGGIGSAPSQMVKQFLVDPITGRSDLLHIKLFHPLNEWYGQSPLDAALGSVEQHNAVSGHNLALLTNGGRPSGALMLRPQENGLGLTEAQRETLREDLRQVVEGSENAGRVMILEGDFDWKEMGLTPKDLDFVAGKNLSAREICQAFGVPPMLAGVPGDATFANYREARLHLWEDTVLPLLELLVTELTVWLLPYFGQGYRLGYDLDSIQALAPKREQLWAKIAAVDFLTQNEKRQAVGYGPLS